MNFLDRRELVKLFSVSKEFYRLCIEILNKQLSERQGYKKLSIRDLQLSSRTLTSNRLFLYDYINNKIDKEIIEVDDVIEAFFDIVSKKQIFYLLDKDYILHIGELNDLIPYDVREIKEYHIKYGKIYNFRIGEDNGKNLLIYIRFSNNYIQIVLTIEENKIIKRK